jgi:UPF0755 protein
MDEHRNWSSRESGGSGGSSNRMPGDKPPGSRWIKRAVVIAGFVVLVIVCAVLLTKGIDWFQAHSTSTTELAQATEVEVTIEQGMTAVDIGGLLEEAGVIGSSAEFVDTVKERGTESTLLPGTYTFQKGLELLEVVDMLEHGIGSARFKVMVPEGLAISQTAARLDEQGDIGGAQYIALTQQPAEFALPQVGGTDVTGITTLEGLLFPDTYYFFYGDGPTQLIGAQLAAFATKTADLPWANASALGVTPYQIVIIASLIEKECSVPEERAIIARVIYNRLAQGMNLGIDATVRYAVNKWTGDLTDEDLAVDSPYNTRKVTGIPPTPIASPGVDALRAALEPAQGDWLYYVLKDTTGNHFFTSSYEDFLQAKENQPQQ